MSALFIAERPTVDATRREPKTHIDGISPRRNTSVHVGMPHLCLDGLSETWLFKEAGHIHWQLLEELTGKKSKAWRSSDGRRLYASFIAVELTGALLSEVSEGDTLTLQSSVQCIAPNRHCSRHVLTASSTSQSAELWMVSSLVKRTAATNRGFARSFMEGASDVVVSPMNRATTLLQMRRAFRRVAAMRSDFSADEVKFRVCAQEDFNAAAMIYFASFPRFTDRAELQAKVNGSSVHLRNVLHRTCFYYGNADASEELNISTVPMSGGMLSHIWHADNLLFATHALRAASRVAPHLED